MKNIEKNYIVVQGYMVQKLNLKGNELLAFSLINGFSQDSESEFSGSIDYIATWLNSSKQTVITVMNTLVEKELVLKKQIYINNVTFNRYTVNHTKVTELIGSKEIEQGVKYFNKGSNILNSSQEIGQGLKELDKGSQNFGQGGSQEIGQGGSQNFGHNNIEDKIIKKDKNTYRAFAHLSLSFSEFEKLKELGYSENQINTILDDIENYKKNTSYKSLFLTAKKWLAKEPKLIQQQNKQEEPKKAPSVFKYV